MTGPRHRHDFGRPPKKGSLMRRMLKMILSPEGATTEELLECGIGRPLIQAYIAVLTDQKGWDIRRSRVPKNRLMKDNYRRPPALYQVVGKVSWNGKYRPINRQSRFNEGDK